MQNPNNPNLAESVASNNRNLVVWLAFDWGRDGSFGHPYSNLSDMVISADLDKSMSGALPPSTPFVEGTAATELRLTLGGSRKPGEPPANVVFAKYNPASPLYNTDLRNTPVVYWVGEQTAIGIAWTQQFTGWVRSAKVSADSGEVEIVCLDAAQKLSDPIWLQAFSNGYGEMGELGVGSIWTNFNSHWVIDRILRENGYSTTPLAHPDAVYSATLHGGTCPEIGFPTNQTHAQFDFTDRWQGGGAEPMYLDGSGQQGIQTNGNTVRPIHPTAGNTIGMFLRVNGTTGTETQVVQFLNGAPQGINIPSGYVTAQSAYAVLEIDVNGGAIFQLRNSYNGANYFQFVDYPFNVLDGTWRYIQAEATFTAANVVMRIKVNDSQWYEKTVPAYPAVSPPSNYTDPVTGYVYPYIEWPLWMQTVSNQKLSDIQIYETKTPKHAIYTSAFRPNSILDKGLNGLSAIPEFNETPAWDILRDIVTTEFGSLFVDEQGRVVFRNMENSRTARTQPDLTLSSDKVSSVTIQDATDNVVNVITGFVQNYKASLDVVFDANKDTVYFDRRDNLNRQLSPDRDLNFLTVPPATQANPITPYWPEVRGMIWPAQIGRNIVPYLAPDMWNQDESIKLGVGAVNANDGAALVGDDQPTVDVWQYGRNSLYIAVFNQDFGQPLQLSNGRINDWTPPGVTTTGNKTLKYCLKIPGVVLFAQREIPYRVDNPESIAKDGYRPFTIEKNDWTQELDSMRNIAQKLLADVVLNPIPLIDDITAPMDQRVQLGDTISIKDVGPLGGSLMAVVTGINRRVSPEGATDTYSLKLIFQPSSWILGDPTYSILGQTTILAENVDN